MNARFFIGALLFAAGLALVFITAVSANAAPGEIDASFGNGGTVWNYPNVGQIAIQNDGKIVVSGTWLARYNDDGSLDHTFGSDGVARTGLIYSDHLAIQPDGKIVTAGYGFISGNDPHQRFALVRYNANGSPDMTFGNRGVVMTSFGGNNDYANSLAIQHDGKIVVLGVNESFPTYRLAIARYNSNGSLDPSFGSGGKIVRAVHAIELGRSVVIQSDGKLVVTDYINDHPPSAVTEESILLRFNPDGSVDPSFGSASGEVALNCSCTALTIQPDDKVIVAGHDNGFEIYGFALERFTSSGHLDPSFGSAGQVVTKFRLGSATAYAVAVQQNGKIIAAGTDFSDMAIARYNLDGSLDSSFGTGGRVLTGAGEYIDFATSTAVQPDGKFIVGGTFDYDPNADNYYAGIVRYLGDQALIVTRSDDRNNSVCVPGDCSLHEAVNAANASPADDTINFASGLTRITLASEIVINNAGALTINGSGANHLTIDGGPGTNRIFNINQAKVTISGVTLTGGNGPGGAIYVHGEFLPSDSSLTLDSVNVTANSISGGFGGGVYLKGGGIHRVINSTFSNNTVGSLGYGGAFYYDGQGGSLTVVNSTISGNSAGYGAGFVADCGGTTILRNVTVTNNAAGVVGGGIYQSAENDYVCTSKLNLGNSIVAGNTGTHSSPAYAPDIYSELSGSFTTIISAGGNLIGDSTHLGFGNGILYQASDILGANPLLGVLKNNGGPVLTHELLQGSPLIDKGLNRLVSSISSLTDQRGAGFSRIRDGNNDGTATVDVGAFEVQLGAAGSRPTPLDFDGDGRADLAYWREAGGVWSAANLLSASVSAFQFGQVVDRIVPGDYDGDGKSDYAVWRPSTGIWYSQQSGAGFKAFQFGVSTDLPMQADFDGDGKTDIAVFRPSTGTWYMQQSTGGFAATQFGVSGDKPVAGDYDGDGKADIAVYRPSNGTWYQLRSTPGFTAVQFGISTDKVVPADYDGDGTTDLAVYRDGAPGVWYLLQSTGGLTQVNFGTTGDIPVPADYDGDGRADVAVFRPSDATWYLLQSTSGFTAMQFGAGTDKPVGSAAVPVQ